MGRAAVMKRIMFCKMQASGNDFLVIDNIRSSLKRPEYADICKKLCRRRFSVGADGMIVAEKGRDSIYRMRIFNSDGSEAEMC